MPSRERLGRDPDCEAAPLLECPVVLWPVADLVARPGDLVAARLIGLVGHRASRKRGSGPIRSTLAQPKPKARNFAPTPSDTAKGFEVLPRRWVVERTLAWLGRCRRLAKDWEKTIESSSAWALVASIRLLSRRLARYCYPTWLLSASGVVGLSHATRPAIRALSRALPRRRALCTNWKKPR